MRSSGWAKELGAGRNLTLLSFSEVVLSQCHVAVYSKLIELIEKVEKETHGVM